MAYDDYEDRDLDLDRGAELYDDDMYDSTDVDNFGETLDSSAGADRDMAADDELAADDTIAEDTAATGAATSPSSETDAQLEDSFNETLSDNPHLDDQLGDSNLNTAAESDYSGAETDKHEGIIDKAKDKLDDLTGHNK